MTVWRDYEEEGVYELPLSDNRHRLKINYTRSVVRWSGPCTHNWVWSIEGPEYNFHGILPETISVKDVQEAQNATFSAVKKILMDGLDLIERAEISDSERIVRGED